MCPGGFVVNAASEKETCVVNGMSYSKRDSRNANSAIVTTVTPQDYPSKHPLAGVEFQRKLERKALLKEMEIFQFKDWKILETIKNRGTWKNHP